MTSRQQKRLELAEAVCRLAMQDRSCGLTDRLYCPDVAQALHCMQREVEKQGNLKPGSAHWLGELAESIETALCRWMTAVGIDPASYDKAATQLMAMELAKDALGPEYEGEIVQTPQGKEERPWVECTADERAAALAAEIASGRVKGMDEIRIAIAAEILEAEHVARQPFLEHANAMFQCCEDKKANPEADVDRALEKATVNLLRSTARWMTVRSPLAEAMVAADEEQTK